MKKYISLLIITVSCLASINFVDAKTYYSWPRWGCYSLSSSWNKVYVSHQLCARNDEGSDAIYNSKTKKTYYTGPKWGCFYYGANWKKMYVAHSYCKR